MWGSRLVNGRHSSLWAKGGQLVLTTSERPGTFGTWAAVRVHSADDKGEFPKRALKKRAIGTKQRQPIHQL